MKFQLEQMPSYHNAYQLFTFILLDTVQTVPL
jgi:hypothetical protein